MKYSSAERTCCICIHNNKILLLKRINKGKTYWTFPGGGIEPHESPEEGALRETKEETNIEVEIIKKAYTVSYSTDRANQNFFLCKYMNGTPRLPWRSEEFWEMLFTFGGQQYIPQWVDVEKVAEIELRPRSIHTRILIDIRNEFVDVDDIHIDGIYIK